MKQEQVGEVEQRSIRRKKIVLIAMHFGPDGGGEAIKAYQFAAYLRDHGTPPLVITHARAVASQGGRDLGIETLVVPDTLFQRMLWRIRPLAGLLSVHFQLAARQLIRRHIPPDPDTVLHYIGPVSPVLPRFFPDGYDVVLGPLTGNIYHPPAFRHRTSLKERLAERLHGITQRVLRVTLREKQRARVILVSGYERTRASLRLAGAHNDQMVDVVDSGVNNAVLGRPRIIHKGINHRFMCSGRLIQLKGYDLAIRALTRTDPNITLDIYGDGIERASLEALTQAVGVKDRVRFVGWTKNGDLLDAMPAYRGYIFPTLREANGIAMQEAMMLGLPVIATRWGGPEKLADDKAAWYLDPTSEDAMIEGIADAMACLAQDPERAEAISREAHAIAQKRFTWEKVSKDWIAATYGSILLSNSCQKLSI